jgi:hypothetical protein
VCPSLRPRAASWTLPWQLVCWGGLLMASLMAWHRRFAKSPCSRPHRPRDKQGVHSALTFLAWCTMLLCTEASDVPGLSSVQLVPSNRRGMLTIALALVSSVKSELQSGQTISQDTAPASIEWAAHKHVPGEHRRALFFHSHTPYTPHPPPSSPPPPSLPPVTVSTSAGLTSALANTAVSRIVLASGTYNLIAGLSITRSVVLEAAAGATVTLNAQASSSSLRRVLHINPGSSGVVQLIGLRITGGYVNSVRAHVQMFPSPRCKYC